MPTEKPKKQHFNPKPKIVLTDDQINQIQKLAAVLKVEDIADFLGISERTLERRLVDDERAMAAYKKGRQQAIAGVATSLLQQARDGNITAQIFYLKTQAGWRETTRHEHHNVDVKNLSDEELRAIVDGDA